MSSNPAHPHTVRMQMLNRERARDVDRVGYSIIDFAADSSRPEEVRDSTAAWLRSSEMSELFALFGHPLRATGLRDRLAEAEEASREIFDFRRGGERWEAEKAEFSSETTELLDQLISLIYREPNRGAAIDLGRFDHALVLGGRINTCLMRTELLGDLLAEDVQIGHVWGLGSRRAITDAERVLAGTLTDEPVDDELDAMSTALIINLALDHEQVAPKTSGPSEIRTLATYPVPVTGLAAAPGPGKPRATTSDTYRYFVETADAEGADSILIVTSAIHGPFQHAQALAELGLWTGARITTVGGYISTSRHDAVRTTWTTAEWLQEVRSAIWSMRMMYDAFIDKYPALEDGR